MNYKTFSSYNTSKAIPSEVHKIIYDFSCPDGRLWETKRCDLPEHAPKSEVSKWYWSPVVHNMNIQLTLVSRDGNSRIFEEGKVVFTDNGATFTYGKKTYDMTKSEK